MSKTNQKHIAVFAFPFATHAAPLLSLVRSLSVAAPDVKFSFFSTAKSNTEVFGDHDVGPNISPRNISSGIPENYAFSGNPHEPVEMFMRAIPGNFKEAVDAAAEEIGVPVTCLLTDAFFWFAADWAEEMNVPWVPLWTAGPIAILMHVETDLIRREFGPNAPPEATMDFLPGLSKIRAADAPQGVLSGGPDSAITTMLHKMGQMIPRSAVLTINSFQGIDPASEGQLRSRFKQFLNIGPFVLTCPQRAVSDPDGCLEWLEKREEKSVVYISFGSVISPPPPELEALSQALEEGGFPFLWSFRGNPSEKLPKGFLERTKHQGKFVSWAPQLKVLEHHAIGAFLTHCGWNSVLEGIIGVVPMICRPFFGDQQLNTRIVEAVWRTGVRIEGGTITKDGAMQAIKQVLSSGDGENMRKKLEELKGLALEAVKPDGSSTKHMKDLVEVICK